MIDKTAIFNAALAKVGGFRVNSPDDDAPAARALRDAWDRTLRFTLASHSWDFATQQFELARLEQAPVARYRYAYQKPAAWLRTVSISEDQGLYYPLLDFRDIGGRIVTDASRVFMECVVVTEDTASFSGGFVECLCTRLAFEIAKSVTTSDSMREGLWKLYEEALRTARSQDAINGPPRRPYPSSWVQAKYGG